MGYEEPNLKQTLSVLLLFLLIVGLVLNQVLPADAAKGGKKKGLAPNVLAEIVEKTDNLTKKLYERELYTPEDANTLISLKLQLDAQMDALPDAAFAPIYYKLGNIFKARGNEKDAIICYQTILENFSQTAYAPKSRDILEEMGVEIKVPVQDDEEDF
jgi:tetratricopeptide (TPR) repeat protein